ncbi:MAG: hypothetical protein V1847_05230 [Candidatus Diapherotrites archaeon]
MKKTLKKIIDRRKSGLSRDAANMETIAENLHKLKKTGSIEYLQNLARKVYPLGFLRLGKTHPIKIVQFVSQKVKRKAISETFLNPQKPLGLLVVNPEMYGELPKIRNFLENKGFHAIHLKRFQYTPSLISKIYGKEIFDLPDFPIRTSLLESGISVAVVLEVPKLSKAISESKWLNHLRRKNPKNYEETIRRLQLEGPQFVLSELLKGPLTELREGTIRSDIVDRYYQEKGFYVHSDHFKKLDQFGFLAKTDVPLRHILSGVHSPKNSQELFKDAASLFSMHDLKLIRRKAAKLKLG